MSSVQEAWWAGSWGTEYTARNRVDWRARRSFWELIIGETGAKSILEVGCNAGWNLRALREADHTLKLRGVDLNADAIGEAVEAGFDVHRASGRDVGTVWPKEADLVFTAGCLIHVAPAELSPTMSSIIKASKRFVLAVEYAAETEEEIDYRGNAERLWKRPYGEMYQAMGLDIVLSQHLAPGDGFDNCTAWLLRVPE